MWKSLVPEILSNIGRPTDLPSRIHETFFQPDYLRQVDWQFFTRN